MGIMENMENNMETAPLKGLYRGYFGVTWGYWGYIRIMENKWNYYNGLYRV